MNNANTNTNCQEFLDKEVTIYYGEDKEVQGVIINSTPDLGITMQFSKIKDSDVLSYSNFNNKIFIWDFLMCSRTSLLTLLIGLTNLRTPFYGSFQGMKTK